MTKDNLSQIAGYNIRKAKPTFDRTAHLVIDMQKYFDPIAEPVIERVVSLISACRKQRIKVFYTRHDHRKENDGSMLSKW